MEGVGEAWGPMNSLKHGRRGPVVATLQADWAGSSHKNPPVPLFLIYPKEPLGPMFRQAYERMLSEAPFVRVERRTTGDG